jgi:hypothetical protein
MNQQSEVNQIQPMKSKGGVWVVLAGNSYQIPPLNFCAIQALQDKMAVIQGMSGVPTPEQMRVVAEVVQMAMRRNYPEITTDEIVDMLDLGNFRTVFDALLGMSGYTKGGAGELSATSP